MELQRRCFWVEPHFRSQPVRPVHKSRRTRPRPWPRGGAPQTFADLSARLQPAVVNISTRQRVPVRTQADPLEEFFRRFGFPDGPTARRRAAAPGPRTRETGSLGSGFIISSDGYIVTNNHLIQSAAGNGTVDQVTVT